MDRFKAQLLFLPTSHTNSTGYTMMARLAREREKERETTVLAVNGDAGVNE